MQQRVSGMGHVSLPRFVMLLGALALLACGAEAAAPAVPPAARLPVPPLARVSLASASASTSPSADAGSALPPSADRCACQPPTSDDGSRHELTCGDAVPANEARAVLQALFPARLARLAECRKPAHAPQTWVEADELQAHDYATGQFAARIVRRTGTIRSWKGETTPSSFDYDIVVDNCQQNTFAHVVHATFAREELAAPHPKPVYRCECHPTGGGVPSCP